MKTVQACMLNRIARAASCLAALSLLVAFPLSAQNQKKKTPKIAAVSSRYALILADQPVTGRFPGRVGFQSAEARSYRTQLEAKQESLKSQLRSRNFVVTGSISVLGNDVYVISPPERVEELKALPGVTGVVQMRPVHPLINRATTLMNAPAAWTTLGGISKAGAGMKVAILDSGIDQTHPAFQDSTLTMPSGFPVCTTGHPEDCNYTTTKVIAARSYVRMIAAGQPATSQPDDYSPRDRLGHGTAVASVVAANTNSSGAVTFNGMAPKAYLGNYKIYNSPGLNYADVTFEDVAVAAINDAFADGFDIANFSSGVYAVNAPLDTGSVCGQTANTPCDYIAYNFEKAAKNGMVIAVAAGNDGFDASWAGNLPDVSLMSSPGTAPDVITVGGTMNSHVFYPGVTVPGGGSSLTHIGAQTSDGWVAGPFGATSAPLVDVSKVGDGYACSALPAYSLYNSFALIARGPSASPCAFAVKAANAANAGAIGIIFYDYSTDAFSIANPITTADSSGNIPLLGPVVMVSNTDGVNLQNYVDAHSGAAVTIDPNGTEEDISVYNTAEGFPDSTNQLVSYSSPGPNPGSLTGSAANGAFIVKPDMVATSGADPTYIDTNQTIYCCSGMYLAAESYDPLGEVYSTNGYIAAEGTSFASPMVAGAAALVWQQHPNYTAAQVRSALINYSGQDTTTDDYGDTVGVGSIGAGRLNAGNAVNATVTVSPVSVGFGILSTALPAAQTLQITNSGTASVTLAATASAPMSNIGTAASGVSLKLGSASVTIAAGATASLSVSLTGAVPASGQYFGTISLAATGIQISVPYLFIVPSTTVFDMFSVVGGQVTPVCFESTPNGDAGPLGIKLVDLSGAPITNTPVKFTVSPRASATLKSLANEPACTSTTSGTYTCNTDSYGVAWAEVFGGASAGLSASITASAGGITSYFGAQEGCGTSTIPVPAITSISDASASALTTVAPGSYISIYGSGLVNPEYVVGSVGDSATYIPLPLTIDYVNVSFDVPGAYDGTPLDYNGAPGYLTFVGASAGQINLQIPWELQGANSVMVKVMVDGYATSNLFTLPLATYAPALFAQSNGVAAAVDATNGLVLWPTSLSGYGPTHAGDVLELYANGLGPVTNQPASGSPAPSGPFAQTKSPVTVTIGGQNAPVSFAGLAPGFPGLYQVNVTVPSGLASGNQAVVLSIGGVTAKTAQVPIQ